MPAIMESPDLKLERQTETYMPPERKAELSCSFHPVTHRPLLGTSNITRLTSAESLFGYQWLGVPDRFQQRR